MHFRCPHCRSHNVQDPEVPELNLSNDTAAELTSEGETILWCEACDYEFPALVWCDGSQCRFALQEFPDIVITGDAPSYAEDESDFWIDYDPPADPLAICVTTLDQIVTILTDTPTHKDDPQLLNRMVFSQAITALETYLFDTLVRRVLEDRSALTRLLERDKQINQEKFTLRTIAANERFLEEQARKYLGSVLYHNLEKVNFLYEAAFRFSMKTTEPSWELLLEAANYRHDCVHRNGVTADGRKLLVFTRVYVGHVIKVIRGLVRRVEHCGFEDDDLP